MNDTSPMMVPILYSEIFGTKPTREDLREILASLDWRYVATFGAGIASISWQRGIEDPRQQQDLVMNTVRSLSYGDRLLAMMTAEPFRRLYTREGLFGIIRIAVEYHTTIEHPPSDAIDSLVKAVLMANELTF